MNDVRELKELQEKENKRRYLDACCVLEDAIIAASISGYNDVESIRKALDYVMTKANISNTELSNYQLNKIVKNNGTNN